MATTLLSTHLSQCPWVSSMARDRSLGHATMGGRQSLKFSMAGGEFYGGFNELQAIL